MCWVLVVSAALELSAGCAERADSRHSADARSRSGPAAGAAEAPETKFGACTACWSAEDACARQAEVQWQECQAQEGDAGDCHSILRRAIAACVDARTRCDESAGERGHACEQVVPGAAELAGTWSGAVVLGGKPIAVVVVLDADGTGIVTGTWRGLSGGRSFTLDGWDGERLAVWHRGGGLRGRAHLVGDTLEIEAPQVGKVVLSRQ